MSKQVTLNLPDAVYQQIKTASQETSQPIDEIVANAIRQVFPELDTHEDRSAMQAEVAAFEALHAQLWHQYPHQFVAIYHGDVVDHDVDEVALIQRLDKEYADKTILVRQVRSKLPEVLSFRSPRLTE